MNCILLVFLDSWERYLFGWMHSDVWVVGCNELGARQIKDGHISIVRFINVGLEVEGFVEDLGSLS